MQLHGEREKLSKNKLLTCVAITVLLMSLSTSILAHASSSSTYNTSFSLAEEVNQIQYKIPAGTTFNGTITTSGMVRFWASGPNATSVADLGLIDNIGTFSFVANQTGIYTFNFENDLPSTIQVTFVYTANPSLPGTDSTSPSAIYYWAIIGVIAVAGSLAIIIVIRRKAKLVNEEIDKAARRK